MAEVNAVSQLPEPGSCDRLRRDNCFRCLPQLPPIFKRPLHNHKNHNPACTSALTYVKANEIGTYFLKVFARQRAAFPFPLPLSPFPCLSFFRGVI